jgi:hypothetical protein
MRLTPALFRGAKGHGWYQKFLKEGNEGFEKYTLPTPFDWSNPPQPRSKAFFSIKIDNESIGQLIFELADDILPNTVDNFKRLCQNQGVKYPGYQGTKIHLIRKGEVLMGGDIEMKNGAGNHSSYTHRYFEDENFIIPNSHRGILRLVIRLTL